MAGAVQHGASTLPETAFHRFPEVECAEIHLATGFQNIILDHPSLTGLSEKIRGVVRERFAKERKPGETDAQFFYKTRKKALGPLKKDLWDLDARVRNEVGRGLEDTFGYIFDKLRVRGTRAVVDRWVTK